MWSVDYPQTGTGVNEPYDMDVDRNGNVYVTGRGANDYLTVKFRQVPVSVETRKPDLPLSFALHQNYPNPFNPSTTINVSLPTQSDFALTIYDILGREVKSFAFERVPARLHSVMWDGKDNLGSLAGSGVYLYRLNVGDSYVVKRMLLLK